MLTEAFGPYKADDIIWESPYHPQGFGSEYPTRVEVVEYGITKVERHSR